MPEIGTSGSMSGDGKRGVAERPKLPRPSSTLPSRTSNRRWPMCAVGPKADILCVPGLEPSRTKDAPIAHASIQKNSGPPQGLANASTGKLKMRQRACEDGRLPVV